MTAYPLLRSALLAVMLAAFLQGCTAPEPASSTPSLAQAYRGRLRLGAAVEPGQLNTPEGRLLAAQFNSVVAENVMKPSRIQPSENEFHFAPADAIVDFAQQHSMTVRGHTLLWYKRTPDWFWSDKDGQPASRDLVLSRLRQHIETVVGRYKGKVTSWDVVNEVIDPAQPDCLRHDQWLQVVGPDYIDWAFRYAHAADPDARLMINDYSTTLPAKRLCLQRVVQGLLARGVPVHGVGHQMHLSIFEPAVAEVDETLAVFARLGLENQITEMDMSLYQRHAYLLSDSLDRLLPLQGQRYEALMKVFLSHPELTSVTWWGISDAHSSRNAGWDWWRSDAPLLFDSQQHPKPGYWGVLKAAQGFSPAGH
jgi:endo-1,4-beta-xylanase